MFADVILGAGMHFAGFDAGFLPLFSGDFAELLGLFRSGVLELPGAVFGALHDLACLLACGFAEVIGGLLDGGRFCGGAFGAVEGIGHGSDVVELFGTG